jgi:nitrous oxidase accessory protein NosD
MSRCTVAQKFVASNVIVMSMLSIKNENMMETFQAKPTKGCEFGVHLTAVSNIEKMVKNSKF